MKIKEVPSGVVGVKWCCANKKAKDICLDCSIRDNRVYRVGSIEFEKLTPPLLHDGCECFLEFIWNLKDGERKKRQMNIKQSTRGLHTTSLKTDAVRAVELPKDNVDWKKLDEGMVKLSPVEAIEGINVKINEYCRLVVKDRSILDAWNSVEVLTKENVTFRVFKRIN